jgi:hypothetical protein
MMAKGWIEKQMDASGRARYRIAQQNAVMLGA